MKVTLITDFSNELVENMYKAARTCYKEGSPLDVSSDEYKPGVHLGLLKKCISAGHLSVVEHANLTFVIEGISRACTHQLVRHRHMSFSQQSQRYVKYDNPEFIVPDTIRRNREADAMYDGFLQSVTFIYKSLVDLGIPAEDARMVLPNATTSKITVTMNLRSLIEFCNKRLCSRAQSEIRQMAKLMAQEVIAQQDWLAPYLVPNCIKLGYCPEEKSCGVKPVKERYSQAVHNEEGE